MQVTWKVPGFGPFAYAVRLTAVEGEPTTGACAGASAPSTPSSAATRGSGRSLDRPRRGEILDRGGRALVDRALRGRRRRRGRQGARARPRSGSPRSSTSTPTSCQQRIEAAPKGRFLPVITLRAAAFAKVEDELTVVPGVSLNRTKASLAPSTTFARTLLGTVGPVTAEQVEKSGGRLAAGDVAGQSGLQRAVRRAARGHADAAGADPLPRHGRRGEDARPQARQARAVAAHAARSRRADRGRAGAGGRRRRARWRWSSRRPATCSRSPTAPRTTSTARCRAAIRRVRPSRSSARPRCCATGSTRRPSSTARRRSRSRASRSATSRAAPPARCRSAPTSRRAATPRSSRSPTACGATTCPTRRCDFGLGEKLETGVPVADADVPAARDDVGQAAMMIGQDRILASPLAMAGVAATVAEGRWRAPRILADAPKRSGERLPEGMLGTLRTLMRSVVTSGHRARRSRTSRARSAARAARRSTAAAIRRPRTRGSSPRAAISPWPCWSRTASRAAASPHPSRGGSSRRCETSARRAGFAAALVIDVPDDMPGGLDDASEEDP